MPRLRPFLIPRPHLIKKLNAGLDGKLTLISAPAGFGKTTLASAWVQQIKHPIAWLSLDESDNDLPRFLTYFAAALQTIETSIGKGLLATLQSPEAINLESILTALLNEIARFPDDMVLILDDYHVIESQPIDRAITFLLNHLPPQLHLVIASRIDPSLPLSRLRARGQMIEIRAHDLRFAFDETAVFLNQMMNFDLSAQEIAALELHTEGWIAGLQLAALSMKSLKGSREIIDLIDNFTGSDRYIQDYLVDEVLLQQPQDVKDFLLQTSILSRMSASLCDAVIGKKDSQAMLENLDTANLFIVPLDNERRWYRYHHLFADLLRQRLRQDHLEQIPTLHSRASEWYERNSLPSDSIYHAFAAEDFERAADLAELAWPAMSGSFQSIAWLGWVKAMPDELVRARPVLSVAYAWAFLNAGKLEAAETRLLDAERWLEPTVDMSERLEVPSTKTVVVDEDQFRSLPASLATARAYHAQAIGDVHSTVKYARRVLDIIPEGDQQWHAEATVILGLAYWASGDLKAAYRTFSDGLARMNPLDVIVGTFVLVDLNMVLGQLQMAISTCEQAIRLATEHGEPIPLGTEDAYTAISLLHREQGDLEAAAQDLATSKRLGEQVELPDWQYRWCIAQARLEETLGNLNNALDLLNEAERVFVRTPLPKLHPVAALKVRVLVKQGRLAEALGWTREQSLSVDDDLSYLREFEYVTLARILIAQYKRDRVVGSIHEAMG
ncbi:MAG: helix-turn-helix transcriptional regulator, partial [bacterium]|nr:helix-turn-helix transcriptional regulator [bacterium]